MKVYYDLHIHSCLSPCGSNDMTPYNLVNMAAINGLQIIALTDHNSCQNCASAIKVGHEAGVVVVPGMELCTSEEAHVVCLFEDLKSANEFSDYVKQNTPDIKNRPEIFGEQLVVDDKDNVVCEEEILLVTATNISISDIDEIVKEYNGVCFPAHIDRESYSVLSSLGDFPEELGFFVAEISKDGDVENLKNDYNILKNMPLLLNSDAHYLENINEANAWLEMPDVSAKSLIEIINGQKCDWSRGV